MIASSQNQQFKQKPTIPLISYYNSNTFSLLVKKKKKRSPFSPQEDHLLKNLVEKSKIINWTEIAACIPGRNSRQCRDRYQHYLDPKVKHGSWTQEEDALILKLYQENGPCWATMSQLLVGRNNNSIKNRYNNHIKNGNLTYYDGKTVNDEIYSDCSEESQIESSSKNEKTKSIDLIPKINQPIFESNEPLLFEDDEIQGDDPFNFYNSFEFFNY